VVEKLHGKVVSIRENGDLVTSISAVELHAAPRDERVTICCDGHKTAGIFSHDHDQPDMTLIAMLGTDECLEICLVGESATSFLGVQVGTVVTVEW
jgi:S-adenosylmethionine hydrolase